MIHVQRFRLPKDHDKPRYVTQGRNRLEVWLLSLLLVFSIVILPETAASAPMSFVNKLLKQDHKILKKVTKEVKDAGFKGIKKAPSLSRKWDISETLLTPSIRRLAAVGEEIVSKGPFASRLINQSNMPQEVIRQYARYGKGDYLKIAKRVGTTMRDGKSKAIATLGQVKGRYQGLNKVLNQYKAGGYDDDMFVRTMRSTGKRGKQVFGVLAKHPKKTLAGAAITWYVLDPEGFEAALNKSTKTVGAFVTTMGMGVTQSVAESINEEVRRRLAGGASIGLIVQGTCMVGFVLLLITRPFRRLLVLPFRLIGRKLNTSIDRLETKLDTQPALQPVDPNYFGSEKSTSRSNL